MTPQFNQRPRRSLMNHDPDEADNEEMNRLRSGFRATIATKWHITKDQNQIGTNEENIHDNYPALGNDTEVSYL